MPKSVERSHDLSMLEQFGTDPGSFLASTYIPGSFSKNGPLVIVLHGSTQSAESYNTGSGWSTLSEECGIALLFPGQKRCNPAASTGSSRATASATAGSRFRSTR